MTGLSARDAPDLPAQGVRTYRLLAVGACGVVAAAGVLWFWGRADGWNRTVPPLLDWLRNQGTEAAIWVILLQALWVIAAIPGPVFTMAAGFLFGTAGGSVVAITGSALGATGAYWIARLVRASQIRAGHHGKKPESRSPGSAADNEQPGAQGDAQEGGRFSRSPKLRALAEFARRGDWTMVLSTRLIPFFPFKLSNYFFGWIRTPFAHFFWGTVIGIAPFTMVSVSTGALAADLGALLHPRPGTSGNAWMVSLACLMLAAVVLALAARRARAEFRRRVPHDGGVRR